MHSTFALCAGLSKSKQSNFRELKTRRRKISMQCLGCLEDDNLFVCSFSWWENFTDKPPLSIDTCKEAFLHNDKKNCGWLSTNGQIDNPAILKTRFGPNSWFGCGYFSWSIVFQCNAMCIFFYLWLFIFFWSVQWIAFCLFVCFLPFFLIRIGWQMFVC